MHVVSMGGGPAGLFAAILLKRDIPSASVTVHERNRADDTFGWGVVFSDETLSNLAEADPISYRKIEAAFIHWTDIEVHIRGARRRSTGHGFSGLSRRRLLTILQDRARELGVTVHFQSEITLDAARQSADLVIAADGVNSAVRTALADHLQPSIDWRHCRFAWLGTTRPLDAFTFVFAENEHGVWTAHAYPFDDGTSTWIAECPESTWNRAGLEGASEGESVKYLEGVFREHLDGHPLLPNRSLWRRFPTITCARWHHENVVLLGDAVHTAHFSIGSGTKLAMEDAVALRDAVLALPGKPWSTILDHYEEARRITVLKTQKAAQTSLEWFENVDRYLGQEPDRFTFNLLTRSKRITYDNLRMRDPALVDEVTRGFHRVEGSPLSEHPGPVPPLFAPIRLRHLELRNRVVVSPMCQYSAVDGEVNDWHLVHLGSRAVGGAGLVITEMTNVSPDGRITPGCAGLWNTAHRDAFLRITRFVHQHSVAKIGIQLAHAGRKGSVHHPWSGRDEPLTEGSWATLGPSPLPFEPHWPPPKAMDRGDMDRIVRAFEDATILAREAEFDLVELHLAHGYLLSSFLSPASNRRTDEYGASLEGRLRFPLEVVSAVRKAWPSDRPMACRISATDWLDDDPDSMTADDAVVVARALKAAGCDVVDVSTGGNTPKSRPVYGRMYQVPFAERIRYEADIPVMAVGAILGADHGNTILAAGRADLICMARPHLRSPYLTLDAGSAYGYADPGYPPQYLAGRPAAVE